MLMCARVKRIINTLADLTGNLSSMLAPEIRRAFRRYDRGLESKLRRDKPRLFQALQEFANIPWAEAKKLLIHFRKEWPDFFPTSEYENANGSSRRSILAYPYWLSQIWTGGETEPHLNIMLGLADAPGRGTPEAAWLSDLA